MSEVFVIFALLWYAQSDVGGGMIWVETLEELVCRVPFNMANWLTKPYILSHVLKQVCEQFELNVVSQGWKVPPQEDVEKLGLDTKRHAFVREVTLMGDGIVLTAGRVTIPESTYQRYPEKFANLDHRPIGEAVLYHCPRVTRSAFEYTFCEKRLQWARRSVFYVVTDPLLVTEYFFATLPHYPEH